MADTECKQPTEPEAGCHPIDWSGWPTWERLEELVAKGLLLKFGDVYYVKPYHQEQLDTTAAWGPGVTRKIESFSG